MSGNELSDRIVSIVSGIVLGLVMLGGCAGSDVNRADQTSAPHSGVNGVPVRASQPLGDALRSAPTQAQIDPPDALVGFRVPEPERHAKPFVSRGTGQFIGRGGTQASVDRFEDGAITLKFVNADIREVIDAVLGDALKLNYIIDPRVQGTVTVRTSRPVSSENVIPVLEEVLSMNGAGLIRSADGYEVIPIDLAGTGFQLDPSFGIHIIPLKYASAMAIRGVLDPYVPPGRSLQVDAAHNLLLFSGTSAEARDLDQLVQVFDVDWMRGMSFAIFPLEAAKAGTVSKELSRVFGEDFQDPLAGMVEFIPIDRQNSVLVITTQPDYLDQAQAWIERLDWGESGAEQRAFIYWVQNGKAKDLAAVMNDIYDSKGKGPGVTASLAPGLKPKEIISQPGSSEGLRSAPATPELPGGEGLQDGEKLQERELVPTVPAPQIEELISEQEPGLIPSSFGFPDAPGDNGGSFSTNGINNDTTARDSSIGSQGVVLGGHEGIKIVADEQRNALVILATPAQFRSIQSTLRQLDVVPLQVFIEASISEVGLNDQLEYGLQWFFHFGDTDLIFSQATSGLVNPVFPGFDYVFRSSDAQAILNALTSITDVRVISAPNLLVLDNERARIQVGDQVPISVQSSTSVTDPNSPIVNSIEYRDTGVTLEITPHVNNSGLLILDVIQEVSDAVETITSGIDSPTIQQRQIHSTVAVQTGETVALGGLIRDRQTERESGIPILSEIPILGNLFKTTAESLVRTELLVLLTPRVIRSSQDARSLTEELRRRMPNVILLEERLNSGLTSTTVR